MSTVMEPKKFAFFMKDDSRSFISRDPYHLSRSNSPARFGPRRTTNSTARPLSPNDISCVTLNTSNDDCPTQRFILWAAVRRNACSQMKVEKRLECPLLRCQQRFPDHESMLRHLITCDLLPDCEYWCYEHDRVERFDDSRCKKCIGHPSKRRKMLSLAKSFFTSLGHNKGKAVINQSASSFSAVPASSEQSWASSDYTSPASHSVSDLSSDCPSRSASNGSSVSSNTRYNSTRSTASNRSVASEATNYTSRSNSYRRGADVLDVSARSSTSASPANSTSFPPPPRYEDIGSALTLSELHSNGLVAELEAPVVVAPMCIPQRAPSTTSTTSHISHISHMSHMSHMSVSQPQHPITVVPDITGINDFLGDIAAMAPTYHNAACVAPELSLTPPPPACPTPPTATLNTISTVDGSLTVDPAELRLSELDSPINWDQTVHTAIPDPFASADANDTALQPFTDMDYLMANNSQSLQYRSSVRSTTSTDTTTSNVSNISMNSMMSDGSDTSFLSNTTSIVSPISEIANLWPTGTQTKLASPTAAFDNFLSNDWTVTDSTITGTTCDPLQSSFVTEMPSMNFPSFNDMNMDLSLLYDPNFPIAPITSASQTLNASADMTAASIATIAPITPIAAVPVLPNIPESTNDASAHDYDESFRDLASSAQDLLATHVITSFAKLAGIDSSKNSLAFSFQNASMRKIMDTGVDSLQKALATGTEVMPPFETLCFLHLVYSFSLGVYKTEAPFKSYALFYQSLEYARSFTSHQDRDNYLEIVSLIWQPAGMTAFDLSESLRQCRNNTTSSPLFQSSLAANSVVAGIIKAFLDNLEMAAILDPEASSPANTTATSETIKGSSLLAMHFGGYKNIATCTFLSEQERNILDTLLLGFPDFPEFSNAPGLKLRLETIRHQMANPATPSNVRWLEISLLQAGKASLGLSVAYFEKFVPLVTLLCDSVYMANKDSIPSRAVFYDAACSLLRINLVCCKTAHQSMGVESTSSTSAMNTSLFSGDLLSGVDFCFFSDKLDLPLAEAMTADGLLGFSSSSSPVSMNLSSATAEATPASSKDSPHSSPQSPVDDTELSQNEKKVEAEAPDCCEICGYRPKGDPKWFRGSMLKHRLTKHSEEVVIYKCNFPGCNSQYRNRPDNLKQHQVEKNHFVGDEATAKKPRKPKTKRTATGEIAATAAKKQKTTG